MTGEPGAKPTAARRVEVVEVDGVRLRACVAGEAGAGPPVLLVMGVGGSLELWGPFEQRLHAAGLRTVAFDAPGTGESSLPRRPLRMAGLARLVTGMLDALGLDLVAVLGVSFGGTLAQQLAHQAPERVSRLVLAATGCGLGGLPGHPRALAVLAPRRRYYSPDYWLRVAPTLYGGRVRREPELLARLDLPGAVRPPSRLGYLFQLYTIAGWSSLPWLHTLRQPTLVLHGDNDPIVPLVNGRLLARRIPHARLEVVHGGGHVFLLDQADEIAPLVARFLGGAS